MVIGTETETGGIDQTVMTGTVMTRTVTTDVTETETGIIVPIGRGTAMSMDVTASAAALGALEDEALTDAASEVILEVLQEVDRVLPRRENTTVVPPLLKMGQGPLMVNRRSNGNDPGHSY